MRPLGPNELRLGEPLPYSVYDAKGRLLLERGSVIRTPEKLRLVQEEGMVKKDESDAPVSSTKVRLPGRQRLGPVPYDLRVLIVDDITLARDLLAKSLRSLHVHGVSTATNGHEAVKAIDIVRPHVVFMDIDMPVLNGLEALKQIKELSPETYVCLVSGASTLTNVKQALDLGVNGFLVKPYTLRKLQAILDKFQRERGEPNTASRLRAG